jgi:hypothetical protein
MCLPEHVAAPKCALSCPDGSQAVLPANAGRGFRSCHHERSYRQEILEHARARPRYHVPRYAYRRRFEGASLGRGVNVPCISRACSRHGSRCPTSIHWNLLPLICMDSKEDGRLSILLCIGVYGTEGDWLSFSRPSFYVAPTLFPSCSAPHEAVRVAFLVGRLMYLHSIMAVYLLVHSP